MGEKEGLEQQADQTAKAQLDWLDVDLFSEDSSLILSAEGPLGILLGLNYPGYTSMGLGDLVLFRLLQLENIREERTFQATSFLWKYEIRCRFGMKIATLAFKHNMCTCIWDICSHQKNLYQISIKQK